MRTEQITICQFNELSEDAKQVAINWFREQNWKHGYAWSGEINDSYKAVLKNVAEPLADIDGEISGKRLFAWVQNNLSHLWTKPVFYSKHEGGEIKRSSFDYKYNKCLKYRRSRIQVINEIDNCPFTGVCYDVDFLQPVIDFLKYPDNRTTNEDLSREIKNLFESVHENDRIYQDSESYIIEEINANEYEFLETGERY